MKRRFERALTAAELEALSDEDIDTSDVPPLDDDFWNHAKVVMPAERDKTQVTAKFDRDVIEWFKRQGPGYQARMNAVLRSFYLAHRS